MESNLSEVVDRIVVKMDMIKNPDIMLRSMATATLSNIHRRVHTEGKATDGSLIGVYSKSYMAVRSGNYSNATRWKRGERSGQHKDKKKKGEAGVYTRGNSEGNPRAVYNRGTDSKVVLSLTRQMEGDIQFLAIEGGKYGIGYSNTLNFNKAMWAEETYNKRIWGLSSSEEDDVRKIAKSFINEQLHE